jgi:hypothetical protein
VPPRPHEPTRNVETTATQSDLRRGQRRVMDR